MSKRSNWSLIGIPDHLGVFHVGGRLGAHMGPRAFREVFSRFKGTDPVQKSLQDCGDLESITQDIEANHRQAADFISRSHLKTGISVVVGGGHDHGYSHLLGISEALKTKGKAPKLGCINIDAHLDVRKPNPTIGSGSPFYLALEKKVLASAHLIEFGIQSHCNAPELWKYIEEKKVQVVPFDQLRNGNAVSSFKSALKSLKSSCDSIVISLDLDAAAQAFAPGVSAPQAEGFTSSEIIEMMEIAGAEAKVVSLGIFELNPLHDLDFVTSRLGATSAYHFIAEALKI